MASQKRSSAAKKAWRTRKARYGESGMKRRRYKFNYDILKKGKLK